MMAELPQPAELPRDLVSVVGLFNSRAEEFSFGRWVKGSRFLKEICRVLSSDLLEWLSIVLVVPALIYGAAELALTWRDL